MAVSEAKGFLSSKIRRVRITGMDYKKLAKALTASHPTAHPKILQRLRSHPGVRVGAAVSDLHSVQERCSRPTQARLAVNSIRVASAKQSPHLGMPADAGTLSGATRWPRHPSAWCLTPQIAATPPSREAPEPSQQRQSCKSSVSRKPRRWAQNAGAWHRSRRGGLGTRQVPCSHGKLLLSGSSPAGLLL